MTDYTKNNPVTGKPWTAAEMQAKITQLEQERDAAVAKNTRDIRMTVAENSGAISLQGVNARFPVTLHYGQLERIFKFWDAPIPAKLAAFAEKHKAILSAKDDTDAVQASKLALRKASTDPDVSHAKEQKETK